MIKCLCRTRRLLRTRMKHKLLLTTFNSKDKHLQANFAAYLLNKLATSVTCCWFLRRRKAARSFQCSQSVKLSLSKIRPKPTTKCVASNQLGRSQWSRCQWRRTSMWHLSGETSGLIPAIIRRFPMPLSPTLMQHRHTKTTFSKIHVHTWSFIVSISSTTTGSHYIKHPHYLNIHLFILILLEFHQWLFLFDHKQCVATRWMCQWLSKRWIG